MSARQWMRMQTAPLRRLGVLGLMAVLGLVLVPLAASSAPSSGYISGHEAIRSSWPLVSKANTTWQTAQVVAGDENWQSGFHLPGLDGVIYAMAVDDVGNIYVGGLFRVAGAATVNNIAKWDGVAWSALGTGTNNYVRALVVDDDGNLYAGGSFSVAGGVPVYGVAKWDGNAWSALGTGMNSFVYALTVDGGGSLYAGGLFTSAGGVAANRVAKWDGNTWSALGSGVNKTVNALAVTASGQLYVGGLFDTAGGMPSNGVAMWDGNTWSALGAGITGWINTVAVGADGLYVGGSFSSAGGIAVNRVARWDGSAWSALGDGLGQEVNALVVDASGALYAAGTFTIPGGLSTVGVMRWDGMTWSAMESGPRGTAKALAATSDGSVYAAGPFSSVGGAPADGVARWQNGAWSAVAAVGGNGLNGYVKSVLADGNGNIYVGGGFTVAGGTVVNRIARWDGVSWSPLGGGMGLSIDVEDMALGANGNLYVVGGFQEAGGVVVNGVARWDGNRWWALGAGVARHGVYAVAIAPNGDIYVGGAFTFYVGGVQVNNIARWNGNTWSALGTGMSGPVHALAIDKDGGVYAAGYFTTAGGVTVNSIARWNGSTWSALGGGVDNSVYALALDANNRLYAGGDFTRAGAVSASRLAQWDGATWSAIGGGLDGMVEALAFDGRGNLYVAGVFTHAGGVPANRIARWNGTSWFVFGGGTNDRVGGLAVAGQGDLYVGGWFTAVGSKASARFAHWSPPPNQPPVAEAAGPYSTVEGGSVQLSGLASSDPNDGDLLTSYVWDLDGDGLFGETGPAAEHGDEVGAQPAFLVAGLDGPTSVSVSLRVTDSWNASAVDTAEVQIANLEPTVQVGSLPLVYEDEVVSLPLTRFGDPSPADTHTAVIDWGDGVQEPGVVDQASGTVSGSHIYTEPGNYSIFVVVRDDDGYAGTGMAEVLVLYGFQHYCIFAKDGIVVDEESGVSEAVGSNGKIEFRKLTTAGGGAVSMQDAVILGDYGLARNIRAGRNAEVKKNAQVQFDVVAKGNITLRENASVGGNITAGGAVNLEAGATVGGSVTQQGAVPSLPPLILPTFAVSATGPDVTVKTGKTLSLPPGSYGKLVVQNGATLNLIAGNYKIKDVTIESDAFVNLDAGGGTLSIDVQQDFEVRERAWMAVIGGLVENILVRVRGGNVTLKQDSMIFGTYFAPSANITLADRANLLGAFYSKNVHIGKNVTASCAPASSLILWSLAP